MTFSWLREVSGSYEHPDLYMKVQFSWLHDITGMMW